jgi:hypothetical protein
VSTEDFKLESVSADYVPPVTDHERAERMRAICASPVYTSLSGWDRDFATDVHGLERFSPAQRFELDRIWKKWGGAL